MKKLGYFCFFLSFLFMGYIILEQSFNNVNPRKFAKNQTEKARKMEKKNYRLLIYEIKTGDTLEEICRSYLVNEWQVSRSDGSRPWQFLKPGELLVIKKINWGTDVVIASWYGPGFHGRKRADGKRYDMHQISVAHKYLPLGTELQITNLENNLSIRAKVNDRGPYVKGRGIDLSLAAAQKLGAVKPGLIPVRITVIS